MSESIFLNVMKGMKTDRPPVWFMRQAGRVLPSYLALREQYSFQELMEDPALTAQVTLLPIEELDVDAAILFSDILVIPQALGMKLNFTDKGPQFESPVKDNRSIIHTLKSDPESFNHIYQAIDIIKSRLSADKALIGFCGAPFTTLCYMIQGNSAQHTFNDAIQFVYRYKSETLQLLEHITELSVEYAVQQVRHGIDAFQLFDTHAGLLPDEFYLELMLPFVRRITSAVRQAGCPVIFFPKGIGLGLKRLTYDIADVISIDWQASMHEARLLMDASVGLQGNLDPRLLSIEDQGILLHALEQYKDFGQKNQHWIFNTGHGLMPDNRIENVKLTVEWIKHTHWQRT
jgi:uroporphyrinogen decarboxylase